METSGLLVTPVVLSAVVGSMAEDTSEVATDEVSSSPVVETSKVELSAVAALLCSSVPVVMVLLFVSLSEAMSVATLSA